MVEPLALVQVDEDLPFDVLPVLKNNCFVGALVAIFDGGGFATFRLLQFDVDFAVGSPHAEK